MTSTEKTTAAEVKIRATGLKKAFGDLEVLKGLDVDIHLSLIHI